MPREEDSSNTVPGSVFVAAAARYPEDIDLTATEGYSCYLETTSGETYLDYVLGGGALIAGHDHPHIVRAIKDRAEEGTTSLLSNELTFDLAKRVIKNVPSFERVKFLSTGSQATFFALRLARAFTGREKILKFAGAYHGWYDSVLVSSSYANPENLRHLMSNAEYPRGTVDSSGIVTGVAESTLVAPFNDLETTREIVDDHAEELAAIIVEPIMQSIPPVDGFLSGLREVCNEHGIVLIFDEIITGFRLALGGAQEHYGVAPDLAVYGKAMGGGVPISVLGGDEEIMRLSDPNISVSDGGAFVSGTFSGNPLCAAASHATLDLLEDDGTYKGLNDYADAFRNVIHDLLEDSSLPWQPLGEGPIIDFIITDDQDVSNYQAILESDMETRKRIDKELLIEGLLQAPGAKRHISIEHDQDDLRRTEEAYKIAIDRIG